MTACQPWTPSAPTMVTFGPSVWGTLPITRSPVGAQPSRRVIARCRPDASTHVTRGRSSAPDPLLVDRPRLLDARGLACRRGARLLLRGSPRRCSTRHLVGTRTRTPRSAATRGHHSSRVASGWSAPTAARPPGQPRPGEASDHPHGAAGASPVRCGHHTFSTQARLTPQRAARWTWPAEMPLVGTQDFLTSSDRLGQPCEYAYNGLRLRSSANRSRPTVATSAPQLDLFVRTFRRLRKPSPVMTPAPHPSGPVPTGSPKPCHGYPVSPTLEGFRRFQRAGIVGLLPGQHGPGVTVQDDEAPPPHPFQGKIHHAADL